MSLSIVLFLLHQSTISMHIALDSWVMPPSNKITINLILWSLIIWLIILSLLSPLNNVITRWVENPWTRGPSPVHSLSSSSLSEGFSMPMIWASIKAMPTPFMIIESDWIASSAQLLIITELHKIKEREFLHLISNHRHGVTFMGSETINDLQLHFSRSVLQWSGHHITIHMLLFWLLSFKGQASALLSFCALFCIVE